jgi:YHS domain-containing protein
MAKDIVCGKDVRDDTVFKTTYGDRPFYFCSKKCETDFVGNPIRYVNPSGAVASTEGSPKLSADGKPTRSTV